MPTLKELQQELQNLTKLKISQVDFANALGTTKSNISLRMKKDSVATPAEMKKIILYLNMPGAHDILNKLLDKDNQLMKDTINTEDGSEYEDKIELDYYPDVFGSCGGGAFVFSENKQLVEIPRKFITAYNGFKKYSIINAVGDSMTPYIYDRDKLVIEHWNGEQIRDNRVYIFRFGDNIFIKRLVLNIDQIIVKSDNKEYPVRHIEQKDAADFQIIGRIVGIWREEN